jgi:MFS family permease
MFEKIKKQIFYDKDVFLLTVANGLAVMGYGLSIPFFTIYLNVERGLPASIAGAVAAFAMLTTCAAAGIAGEISDILGRKKVMVVFTYYRALTMFLLAFAMQLRAHYMWVIIFYFATMFFGGFFRPASNAWVADNMHGAGRIKAFSYIRIGFNIGWAAGPALGGFLAGQSFSLAFALTAAVYLMTGVMLSRSITDNQVKRKENKPRFTAMFLELKNPRLGKVCLLIFTISVVAAQLVTGVSLHGVKYIGLSQTSLGFLFGINGLLVVLLQYHIGKLMIKHRLTSALAAGCVIYGLGYIIIGASHAFMLAAVGMALVSVGEMAVSPGSNTLVSNIAPSHLRGRYLGMQEFARQLGMSAGMFAAGVMIEYLSPLHQVLPWIAIGLVSFAAAWGFYKIRPLFTDEEDGLDKPNIKAPPPATDDEGVIL